MICKNCPFGKIKHIDGTLYQVECEIDGENKGLDEECYFPETIAKKGV